MPNTCSMMSRRGNSRERPRNFPHPQMAVIDTFKIWFYTVYECTLSCIRLIVKGISMEGSHWRTYFPLPFDSNYSQGNCFHRFLSISQGFNWGYCFCWKITFHVEKMRALCSWLHDNIMNESPRPKKMLNSFPFCSWWYIPSQSLIELCFSWFTHYNSVFY